MMSNSNSNEDGFFSSLKKAYNEEVKDDAPLKDQLIEGFATGVTETVVHPVRWLKSLIKKE